MTTDYTEVFRDTAAVRKYVRETYAPGSYSSIVDARQRRFLRDLVAREFPYRRPVQHDFACGAGRGIRALTGLVRAAHGYDTSPEMLAEASATGATATWHHIPADGPTPTPAATAGPVIVTILRLLLNVQGPVRDRAIAFAAAALTDPEAGLLVVENHGNRRSLRHLRYRQHTGDKWYQELSHAQVVALLARHGFTVEARSAGALFPQGWYQRRWLRRTVRPLDALLTRTSLLASFGVSVLYVARRDRSVPATAPALPSQSRPTTAAPTPVR